MNTSNLLHQAIQAARNGRELTARDLFQNIVRIDPSNEVAWMWLSGLFDPLEDRIMACEKVLSINPENREIRKYLGKLLEEQEVIQKNKLSEINGKVQRVLWFIKNGNRDEALFMRPEAFARYLSDTYM